SGSSSLSVTSWAGTQRAKCATINDALSVFTSVLAFRITLDASTLYALSIDQLTFDQKLLSSLLQCAFRTIDRAVSPLGMLLLSALSINRAVGNANAEVDNITFRSHGVDLSIFGNVATRNCNNRHIYLSFEMLVFRNFNNDKAPVIKA